MAAGQGFKTFTTGEVLTAGDVNGYLMQGVLVFASAAARDAAITSPQEGQFAFLKDTNVTYYYDGATWVVSGATGDITAVTAGVGISGGGASGDVTITNSMATAIDAKGDLVPGTGADTFSRLAVGANGTVLTADSAEATGLKWAAASSGALTLIKTATFTTSSGSSTTFDSVISSTYNDYLVIFHDISMSNADSYLYFQYRKAAATKSGANYYHTFFGYSAGSTTTQNWTGSAVNQHSVLIGGPGADGYSSTSMTIYNGSYPRFTAASYNGYRNWELTGGGLAYLNDTIDGFILTPSAGTFSGTVTIYGLAKS